VCDNSVSCSPPSGRGHVGRGDQVREKDREKKERVRKDEKGNTGKVAPKCNIFWHYGGRPWWATALCHILLETYFYEQHFHRLKVIKLSNKSLKVIRNTPLGSVRVSPYINNTKKRY